MAFAQAYSAYLLDRVAEVEEEHGIAAKKRSWHRRELKKMEEEHRAYWHAFVRGRGQFLH